MKPFEEESVVQIEARRLRSHCILPDQALEYCSRDSNVTVCRLDLWRDSHISSGPLTSSPLFVAHHGLSRGMTPGLELGVWVRGRQSALSRESVTSLTGSI